MATQQKPLNLDQSKIEAAAHAFAASVGGTASGPNEKGKAEEYVLTVDGEKPALLHVYKRNDGGTTLQSKVGQNTDLSAKLAEYIAQTCSRAPVVSRPLTLVHVKTDDWQFLLEYLESEDCKVTEEALPHGVRFKVVGPQKDQVVVHRYDNGKFLMQGRPMAVYAMVVAALCELQEDKREVLEAQLGSELVQTTVDGLLGELKEHLPTAVDLLGDTGCAILAPAIALAKVAAEMPDYSSVAFPALRGLEYYMKELFARKGQRVTNAAGLGSFFTSQGAVKSGCAAAIGCKATVNALDKSYALHTRHRNELFHADGVAPIMTKIISKKQEAVDIVFDVFRTIESTHAAIPK